MAADGERLLIQAASGASATEPMATERASFSASEAERSSDLRKNASGVPSSGSDHRRCRSTADDHGVVMSLSNASSQRRSSRYGGLRRLRAAMGASATIKASLAVWSSIRPEAPLRCNRNSRTSGWRARSSDHACHAAFGLCSARVARRLSSVTALMVTSVLRPTGCYRRRFLIGFMVASFTQFRSSRR
jgi:hypothetical protein